MSYNIQLDIVAPELAWQSQFVIACKSGKIGLTIIDVTRSCGCHSISIKMCFRMLAVSCMP